MSNIILVLLSTWVGVIIFFSVIIAPTVFKSMDERNAGLFLRAFFPKYYIFGITICILCLLIYFLGGENEQTISNISFLLIMLIFSIISKAMIPFINEARDIGDAGKNRFKRLHLISVLFNIGTLVIGLSYIYINL